jgi:hypothetical protein
MASTGSILNKASNRFRKLIQDDIRKKNLIKTGDLIRSIDASFKEDGDEIKIQIGAIYYYTFLDDGTKYIKSFNITEDVLDSTEFEELLEDTIVDIKTIEIEKAFKGLGTKNIKIR